jgi:hypothetical protein
MKFDATRGFTGRIKKSAELASSGGYQLTVVSTSRNESQEGYKYFSISDFRSAIC